MCRASEKSKPAEFPLAVALLILLGLTAPLVYAGKDVSLSDVPQAVRATIERELKDAEIDDLERDKDDGKIVYKIEAKGDNDIKMRVAKDGTLLRKEEELDPEALPAAVLDAIKKTFGDMDFGDIERNFRVGRKSIYKIEGDKGDRQIDLEIAEDGSIVRKRVKRRNDDDDLPGDFRDMRRTFMQLRCQLRVVAIGDSRVEKGIDPQYFLGEENRKYPMAFSFGGDVKGVSLAQILVEDYFVHGPKMEWVVYGVSTRIFNRYYRSGSDEDEIRGSRVYSEDKARWATLPVSSELVPAGAVDNDDSPWGFDGDDGVDDDLEDDDERDDALDDLRKGRYKFDTKRFEFFESMIQALAKHNIRMLAFSPPIHPVSIGQPCTDDDGTTRDAYDEYVAKMNAFAQKYPNFYFLDVNKKGEHNIEHKCFHNLDHLNRKGAKKLTLMLNDFMKAVDSDRKKNIEKYSDSSGSAMLK